MGKVKPKKEGRGLQKFMGLKGVKVFLKKKTKKKGGGGAIGRKSPVFTGILCHKETLDTPHGVSKKSCKHTSGRARGLLQKSPVSAGLLCRTETLDTQGLLHRAQRTSYGAATISRLLKIIGLCCRI